MGIPNRTGGSALQNRNLIVLAIAVVFGLAAVWLANSYFGAVAEQAGGNTAASPQSVKILAAKQDIGLGGAITAETVQLVDWPATSVPQGAIIATQAQAFVGQNNATLRPLVAGEPILQSNTSARAVLSATLAADQRAVSIPIDFVTGVAGFVKPGDIVDVVLTRAIPGSKATADEQMATVVLQNIVVLAIDVSASTTPPAPADPNAAQSRQGSKLPEFKAATLMVDAIGAQKLALATQVGKLTLVLRNASDRNLAQNAVVLPRDLGGGGLRIGTPSARPAAARPAAARRTAPAAAAAPPPYRPTMTVLRGTQETVEGVMTNGY